MWSDGDGDDAAKNKKNGAKPSQGDYNLSDDIGERIGEGHDPVEDEAT